MPDALDCLNTINLEWLGSSAPKPTRADISVEKQQRHRRKVEKRSYVNALEISNAAEHLDRLPDNGESLHCIMRGNYNGWDLIPAVLRMIAPATITELLVTTLGFNNKNAAELLDLIDAKKIGRIVFVCSCYFEDSTPDTFKLLADGITERGGSIVAIRNHTKIMLMRTSDGRHLVNESSANLRSCRNIEQFCMSNDETLYNFHKSWIQGVINKATHATA